MSDQQITVQVAAASPIYRRGIAAVLQERGMEVVASAADGTALSAARPADVVLVQPELPGLVGALRALSTVPDRPKVILLVGPAEPLAVGAALRHGPAGLLLQDAGADEFEAAVQAVSGGGGWISAALVPLVLPLAVSGALRAAIEDSAAGTLSRREREVLVLVASGHSNRKVASELFIAENTVKNHVRKILEKLDLNSRVEATLWAVSTGLIDSNEPR